MEIIIPCMLCGIGISRQFLCQHMTVCPGKQNNNNKNIYIQKTI